MAAGVTPVKKAAKKISAIAPNRTDTKFLIDIPADVIGFTFQAPAAGWALDSTGKKAEFTPPAGFTGAVASVGYGSTSHEDSTVEINFPMDIKVSGAARSGATRFDIAAANSGIGSRFTVTVEDVPGETAVGVWAVQGTTVIFGAPKGGALQDSVRAASKFYVMTFSDGSKSRAKLTAEFTTTLTAYDIVVRPDATGAATQIPAPAYCYIPAGMVIDRIRLNGADTGTADSTGASWALVSSGASTTVRCLISDSSRSRYEITYSVVVRNISNPAVTAESNQAKITVSRDPMVQATIMPRAAACLNSTAINGGQTVAIDVLGASSAFHAKDPTSVVLTGLLDTGQAKPAHSALLAKDGKSMRVPNEGIWLVGDGGEIVFTANPAFAVAPTPAGFRFSDVKGNLSDTGVVMIDPEVKTTLGLPAALKALDETAFWRRFHIDVSGQRPPVDPDTFIAHAAIMAGALQTVVQVGRDPLDLDDYKKAFQEYHDNGRGWEDHPANNLRGLVSICKDIVTKALPAGTDELVIRYWRLDSMSRVAAQALKDDPKAT